MLKLFLSTLTIIAVSFFCYAAKADVTDDQIQEWLTKLNYSDLEISAFKTQALLDKEYFDALSDFDWKMFQEAATYVLSLDRTHRKHGLLFRALQRMHPAWLVRIKNILPVFKGNSSKMRLFFLLSGKNPHIWSRYVTSAQTISSEHMTTWLQNRLRGTSPEELAVLNPITPYFFTHDMNEQQKCTVFVRLQQLYRDTVLHPENFVELRTKPLDRLLSGMPEVIRDIINPMLRGSYLMVLRDIILKHFSADTAKERLSLLSLATLQCYEQPFPMNAITFGIPPSFVPSLTTSFKEAIDIYISSEMGRKQKISIFRVFSGFPSAKFTKEFNSFSKMMLPSWAGFVKKIFFIDKIGSMNITPELCQLASIFVGEGDRQLSLHLTGIDKMRFLEGLLDTLEQLSKGRLDYLLIDEIRTVASFVCPQIILNEQRSLLLNARALHVSRDIDRAKLARTRHFAQEFRNRVGIDFPSIDSFYSFFREIDNFLSDSTAEKFVNALISKVTSFFEDQSIETLEHKSHALSGVVFLRFIDEAQIIATSHNYFPMDVDDLLIGNLLIGTDEDNHDTGRISSSSKRKTPEEERGSSLEDSRVGKTPRTGEDSAFILPRRGAYGNCFDMEEE